MGRVKKNCCYVNNLQKHFHGCRSAGIHYVPFVMVKDIGRFHRKASPQVRESRIFMGSSELFSCFRAQTDAKATG